MISGNTARDERISLESTPQADTLAPPQISLCQIRLARALSHRQQHTRQLADAEEQTQLCRDALTVLPASHPNVVTATRYLGIALFSRFQRSETVQDLEEAVSVQRQLIELLPEHHAELPSIQIELALSLHHRSIWRSRPEDLAESIDLSRGALAVCSAVHPHRHDGLHNLGNALVVQYQRTQNILDLEEGIRHLREAIALRSRGHRDRHLTLTACGNALWELCGKHQDPAYLEESVRYHQQALELREEGHPQRKNSLFNLGVTMHFRYTYLGDPHDLDEAVNLKRQANKFDFPTSYARCIAVHGLANSIQDRFHLRGDLDDMDEVMQLRRETLDLAPPGHPMHADMLISCANALCRRFDHTGDLEVLTEAIDLLRQIPLSNDERVVHFKSSNLAEALSRRYDYSRRISDLHECIELREAALGSAAVHSSSMAHDGLCSALLNRFEVLRDSADLERAVNVCHEGLQGRPQGHRDRPRTLRTYSTILSARYGLTHEDVDIRLAFQCMLEAFELLPPGHADRAQILCGLARLYLTQDKGYYTPQKALIYLSEALQDPCRSSKLRLEEAAEIFEVAESPTWDIVGIRPQLLEAYQLAIQLLPRVAHVGLDAWARLRVLDKGETLAARAAMHALLLCQPTAALELLEEGRALFWTQYLRLRHPFHALPPHLSGRLVALSQQLEGGSMHSVPSMCSNNLSKSVLDLQATQRRRLGMEFEELIVEARSTPGFERFMLHQPYKALAHAAAMGPVIILLAGADSCQAILLSTSAAEPKHVSLPLMRLEELKSLAATLNTANRMGRDRSGERAMIKVHSGAASMGSKVVLTSLWTKIMKPLVKALGIKVNYWSQKSLGLRSCTDDFDRGMTARNEEEFTSVRRVYFRISPCTRPEITPQKSPSAVRTTSSFLTRRRWEP